MFRNYLAIALRDLARSPVQASISIGGLVIGLTAMLVIGLLEFSVFTYDNHIEGHDRIYFAFFQAGDAQGIQTLPVLPHELAGYLRQFPEVEAVARATGALLKGGGEIAVRRGNIRASAQMDWADPEFFRIYRAPVLYGNLDTALERPDGAVVNLSTARKYFGRDDVVGQTLEIDRSYIAVIRAVIADPPANATFQAGLFLSALSSHSAMSKDVSQPGMSREKGFSPDMFTLVRLRSGASVENLNRRASAIVAPYVAPPFHANIYFVPLETAFFTLASGNGIAARLLVLAAVAVIILILSCVNFVNLSIARSAQRAVEVAIRKTAGAGREALVVQFLGESILQVFLALLLAMAIVEWSRPSLEAFADGGAIPDFWHDPVLLAAVLGGALLIGFAAGIYPALILSGFSPAAILKGWITNSLKRGWLRGALVAFQFAAMIVFLIASGVLLQQNDYLQTQGPRVPVDNTLLVAVSHCGTALENEIAALPGARAVACSSTAVLDDGPLSTGAKKRDGQIAQIKLAPLGLNFFESYGLKPLAGRFFRPNSGDEASENRMPIVIDETAVRQLGFGTPQAAIGQSVDFERMHRTVIGVVRNFYLVQPQGQIPPMMYSLGVTGANLSYVLHIKIRPERIPETLGAIEALWRKSGAQAGINQIFLSELIGRAEIAPLRLGQAFAGFAGLAMVLACLGLFGISLLTAQRRVKEIGVRKAMGATTRDIVSLLLWQFIKPVLWASAIAWPVAYLAMSNWLSGFSYHTSLDWKVFAGATLATLAVALLTVAAQSIAAARAVPATALRYE
jgi:putative ABC transport system permease protein